MAFEDQTVDEVLSEPMRDALERHCAENPSAQGEVLNLALAQYLNAESFALSDKQAARLRAACEQAMVVPTELVFTAVDWWIKHADVDPCCVRSKVEEHATGKGLEPIDVNAAQVFALMLRDILNQACPRRRHALLTGLHYLCMWNPFLERECLRLRAIVSAECDLADSPALLLADDSAAPGSTNDVRALKEPFSTAASDADLRKRTQAFRAFAARFAA